MKCSNCNVDIPAGTKKCPGCNTPVPQQKKGQAKKFFCRTCGNVEVSPQWNYCSVGHPLKFFCAECGKVSPPESQFCVNCRGVKLLDAEEFGKFEEEKRKREEGEKMKQGELEKESKIPKCENCGERIDLEKNFCDCGQYLKRVCLNCGFLNPLKNKICERCGRKELLDPGTTKEFKDLVFPKEVEAWVKFSISGQIFSFLGTPGNSRVYLRQTSLERGLETDPENGKFEFPLTFYDLGEVEFELKSGPIKEIFKVKVVEELTRLEEETGEKKPPMNRLCIREKGIDGSDRTCDTRIYEYGHYCPSDVCAWNQELKFRFPGYDGVWDRLNCDVCKSSEIQLDTFFLQRNDDTYFRTEEHPHRKIPTTPQEIVKQARKYECPVCKKSGNPGVKKWVLVKEPRSAKVLDAITLSGAVLGDVLKRTFGGARKVVSKGEELRGSWKKGGGKPETGKK